MTYTSDQILRENISRFDHDYPQLPTRPYETLDLDGQIEAALIACDERERVTRSDWTLSNGH